jgi:hypothetical protein
MNYKRNLLGIPLQRRRNRRWLVTAYWMICLCVTGFFMALLKMHPNWVYFIRAIITFFIIFVRFPYLKLGISGWFWESPDRIGDGSKGIRTLFDSASSEEKRKYPPLDERERNQWGKAYQISYEIIYLLVLIALITHVYGYIPRSVYLREPLLWLFAVLILSLPQTILLCTEPDMEEPQ